MPARIIDNKASKPVKYARKPGQLEIFFNPYMAGSLLRWHYQGRYYRLWQQQLGDIVFIELPELATRYSLEEECGVIESVKTSSDLYCPVDGEVVEVNHELVDNPETLNSDPYGDGWMFLIRPDSERAIEALIDASEYLQLIEED